MEQNKTHKNVYLASLTNLAYFALGTCTGWTSPMMPRLRDATADSPLKFGVGRMEEGWISSSIAIGALIGCPLAGPLANRVGRKWALLFSAFSYAVAYFLFLQANTIWFLYVARGLQGIGVGLTCTVMPIYVSEITTDTNRGPIASLMTLFMLSGTLFVYGIGIFMTYNQVQYSCLTIPIIFFLIFFFMPETPYFYAMKRRKSAAVKSLAFLRCKCPKDIEDEIRQIQSAVDADMSQKGTLPQILRNKPNRRAFFICVGLMAFQQLSGIDAVTYNIESIFMAAKSPLNPGVASVVSVLGQIVANLITPLIIERLGRKMILMISAIGMCLTLIVMGTFFYIESSLEDSSVYRLIPIPALMLFSGMYAIGFSPLPWVVMSEVLPSNIKATVSSFSTTVGWIITFVLIRFIPEFNAELYYAFWTFGGLCGLAFIFVLFVVIETKGLSLQEIQEKLS
ncbi:facilitated trehalose transporter Tret1-like [Episyrphus balteatus]|uniref:facilitated trehalose transporter Tret1-like n=1 Tax=Episyrphus balteatus TaxID=286459 RepID=UPI002485405B|nr:facilitated trehalose transporter Tret1-like [Episyrphus balteatus]